ncbi:MAG: hypothetical protein LPD71_09845 [Shewanella sp.]|nr:hypothetical protein [Shewanella sp.]MCF1429301.1 hypothetical protein [Shewanella sp.]MCF1439026.1 hypothetical protein [Shewanella sp.]MCF1456551.1 hypothetical protein [Shewanella sp.]
MEHTLYGGLWTRLKLLLLNVRPKGLKGVAELLAFSLFFMLGLVTLGASLLAGAALTIFSQWQARKVQASATSPRADKPVADGNDQAQANQAETVVIT